MDTLHSEEAKLAPACRVDGGEFSGSGGAGGLSLLAADAGGRSRWGFVLGLVLLQGAVSGLLIAENTQGE